MQLIEQLKEILKANKITFTNQEPEEDNLLEIFEALVPDRMVRYDAECIDEPHYYSQIILMHAESTNGDFEPVNMKITGSIENTITIQFDNKGKTFKLKIDQDDSTWVSESFIYKLTNFAKRNLPENFLELPTTDQTGAWVYLPKKVISKIEKNIFAVQSPDAIVDLICSGTDIESLNWNAIPMDVINGYTKDGETIATAILKSDVSDEPLNRFNGYTFREATFEQLGEFTPLDLTLQNQHGETPYRLTRNAYTDGLRQYMDYFCQVETFSFDELMGKTYLELNDELKLILSRLDDPIKKMHFNHFSQFTFFGFSPEENYINGDNSVFLGSIFEGDNLVGYRLFIQQAGDSNKTLNKQYAPEQVDEIVRVLNLYCTNQLWDSLS